MNTIINERKLGFSDIVNEGLRIFFFKFRDIFLLAILSFVPINFITILFTKEFLPETTSINFVSILLGLFLLLIHFIIGLIVSMSIAVIIEKSVEDMPISLPEAVRYAAPKWGKAVTTSLLASIITLGLTLLFVIPGIIYWTYYIFVLYVVVLRDKHGKEALNYSKTLVIGQWWRVFGILLGLGIVFAIFNGIIIYLLSQISDNPYFAIVPNTVSFFLATIFGVMNVVLFLNNDFVYHQKLVRRIEKVRAAEFPKPPVIEGPPTITRKDPTKTAKPSSPEKVVRKVSNKTSKKTVTAKKGAVKKSTARKGKTAAQRNTAS